MRILILFMFLSFELTSLAQNYKFEKVSKEELTEKFNPLDSSANATYLYKKRRTYFEYRNDDGFHLVTDIHVRLKIYSQEGFRYATKSVFLYKDGGKEEKVKGLKAYTYNLVHGKVKKDKLNKEAIFKTEASKFRNETKFTMPNIKPGTIIEYKYTIVSPFFWNVDKFVLQHDIPIKKLDAKFEAPEYYNFKANFKGFLSLVPVESSAHKKVSYVNKEMATANKARSSREIEFEYRIHKSEYNLSNIPALKEEPFVNNINNYRSAVKYELSFTKFPNSTIDHYSTTWEDVVKTIYKSSDFGVQLNKSGYYEDDINTVIGGVSDPIKKMALIYDFVKSKVKWNGYYNKYTNDGVRIAYKNQVGNVAEINLMLTSMLRHAGLNANPVLVSTRQNGIPLFPTREGYNYVISCVEVPNGVILLDATSKYSSPNVLPFRALNWEGRIIRKSGSSALISLYPTEKSKNTISMMMDFDENGDIKGTIRTIKTAHSAMRYRESYIDADKNQFLEDLENENNGIEISDFVVKNGLDLSKPVMETYKFELESQADVIGDKMYISPLTFLSTTENPFKLEKREFPIDFGYPTVDKYRISINLPEGYIVESLPEPKIMVLPENLGQFKYIAANNGNTIQLTIDTSFNESIIGSQYYDILKEYFKQFIEKENEKMVLTKTIKP